jgi:hypothetical protein
MSLRQNAKLSVIQEIRGRSSFRRRLENPVEIAGEERFDLRVVLFRLE